MRILVLDDDHLGNRLLEFLLTEQGYCVTLADTPRAALAAIAKQPPHLILLDVNLPQIDGFAFFQKLRERGVETPVIFVTAKGEVEDRVRGLKMGGDDYISKPFQPSELVARVEAVLRRCQEPTHASRVVRAGKLKIDPVALEVIRPDGRSASLTPTEMRLLLDLAEHAGRPVTRERLLAHVWGGQYEGESNVVDVYVRRLRRKLERDPNHPVLVQAARGVGYLLADSPSES